MPSNIANNANIRRTLIFNCLTHSRDGGRNENLVFAHHLRNPQEQHRLSPVFEINKDVKNRWRLPENL